MTAAEFHEEWFPVESERSIKSLIDLIVGLDGMILEIGAWEGRSTVAIANATSRTVHTVDTWEGSGHEISAQLAQERDVFAQWQANVAAMTAGNVIPHRMGWREFVPTIREPIAFCFIDAEHSYREVFDNIMAIVPHMSPGAILCGDDAHHGPVREAVLDFFGPGVVLHTASMWVFQMPLDRHDADPIRLRAIHPDLSPSRHESDVDLDRVARIWDTYVSDVSAPDHATSPGTAGYLVRVCDVLQPRRILDMGSGLSSALFRRWAQRNNLEVTVDSFDTDPEWLVKTRDFLVNEGLPVDGLAMWPADVAAGSYDLVFHDLAGGELRNSTAEIAARAVRPGGIVIFDDAQHPGHRATFERVAAATGIVLHSMRDPLSDAIDRWPMVGVKLQSRSELADKYHEMCRTPSDIYLHLPRFVEIVRLGNVQKVIELGTRTGVSTIAWLYALEQTGGHLWSVDLDGKPPIGDYSHWTFIQGDDESDTVLSQLPSPVDVVFLDTSHWYPNTCRELELYLPMVRSGGLIVCHDTELPLPEGADPADGAYPVKRAITEFVARHGLRWTNIPECWGLGIIEVV